MTMCMILPLVLHYFHVTTFFWMFVEGLYLYMLVVETFNRTNIKAFVYVSVGWGKFYKYLFFWHNFVEFQLFRFLTFAIFFFFRIAIIILLNFSFILFYCFLPIKQKEKKREKKNLSAIFLLFFLILLFSFLQALLHLLIFFLKIISL